jgi:hypothetical protein
MSPRSKTNSTLPGLRVVNTLGLVGNKEPNTVAQVRGAQRSSPPHRAQAA